MLHERLRKYFTEERIVLYDNFIRIYIQGDYSWLEADSWRPAELGNRSGIMNRTFVKRKIDSKFGARYIINKYKVIQHITSCWKKKSIHPPYGNLRHDCPSTEMFYTKSATDLKRDPCGEWSYTPVYICVIEGMNIRVVTERNSEYSRIWRVIIIVRTAREGIMNNEPRTCKNE